MKVEISPGNVVIKSQGFPPKRRFNPPPLSDNYNEIGIFSPVAGQTYFYAKFTLKSGDEFMYLYGNGDLVHADYLSSQVFAEPPFFNPPYWGGTFFNVVAKLEIFDKIPL
jgi:hypothetical protein